MESVKLVQNYYDADVEKEWERLEKHPFEFALTCRFLDRYLHPGDRVLDIGGGPGRYSLYLAKRGCQVTLLDLSAENVEFARRKAREQEIPLTAIAGDAREADQLAEGKFDHVLLMGPLYHLTKERDRERCVQAALSLLRPGGTLSMSFISMIANLIYALREEPEQLLCEESEQFAREHPDDMRYFQNLCNGEEYSGQAFTWAYFARAENILSFVKRFPLEILHFFAQEGVTAHNEDRLREKPEEVRRVWLNLCESLCEKEEYRSWAEHLMVIARKKEVL